MILQGIMVDVIKILGIKHRDQTWMAIGAYSTSMGVFHHQSVNETLNFSNEVLYSMVMIVM
jgi:hypothetical protein